MTRHIRIGKHVVVIGGGNVAMDCARSSMRLGAEFACFTGVHVKSCPRGKRKSRTLRKKA